MWIYQKIVLSLLKDFKQGYLELVLPSGEVKLLGEGLGRAGLSPAKRNFKQGRAKRVLKYPRLTVINSRFFRQIVLYGDIGFGEAYMYGWWVSSDLRAVLEFFVNNWRHLPGVKGGKKRFFLFNILNFLNIFRHSQRKNTIRQAKKNIHEHYDLSNHFFELILDKTMTYSSALFARKNYSLEQAQLAKYDRLCREAGITRGDYVLEIGSGWGGFAQFAATHYGCKVKSITISEEQFAYATERIRKAKLGKRVEFELIDYRKVQGAFDKIVSIEMIEAVGIHYLKNFFMTCNQLLKPNGVFAMQAIVCPDFRFSKTRQTTDWIQRYVFPGSFIPSIHSLLDSVAKNDAFFLYNLKDLGKDYARTLAVWYQQLKANANKLKNIGYDDTFIRKWEYYFKYCETAFDLRYLSVVQMIYTRPHQPFQSSPGPALLTKKT